MKRTLAFVIAAAAILYFGYKYIPTKNPAPEGEVITNATNTTQGMTIEDIKVGTGKTAEAGTMVTVHYVGTLTNGTKFDSSDLRGRIPRFEPKALEANLALVDLLGRIADRKGATPAQIALAWLLARKPWIVPIPGTTKLSRLEENLGAVAIELTTDDLREIDRAASAIKVEGARYPERLERMVGR